MCIRDRVADARILVGGRALRVRDSGDLSLSQKAIELGPRTPPRNHPDVVPRSGFPFRDSSAVGTQQASRRSPAKGRRSLAVGGWGCRRQLSATVDTGKHSSDHDARAAGSPAQPGQGPNQQAGRGPLDPTDASGLRPVAEPRQRAESECVTTRSSAPDPPAIAGPAQTPAPGR